MHKKRAELAAECYSCSQSRDFCASTTAGSLSTTAQERPQSRRPPTRSIINCECLPKGRMQALEQITAAPQSPERADEEEDSLLQELVDILDAHKPEAPPTQWPGASKSRSALQSPRQYEPAQHVRSTADSRNTESLKRLPVVRKSRSIKLMLTPKPHFPPLSSPVPLVLKRRDPRP